MGHMQLTAVDAAVDELFYFYVRQLSSQVYTTEHIPQTCVRRGSVGATRPGHVSVPRSAARGSRMRSPDLPAAGPS